MQYKRCKCGKAERWDTGEAVRPCEGCTLCQTTYAGWRGGHGPLEPHDWKPQFNRDTGQEDGAVCTRCHKHKRGD